MTITAEALCPSCRLRWAEEQHAASSKEWTTGISEAPGYRLVCPRCEAATMIARRGPMHLHATCSRCGQVTRQLQAGAVVPVMLGMMVVPFFDSALSADKLLMLAFAALVALVVGYDLWKRRRFKVASYEQIEAAEQAEKEARRVRIVAGLATPVRIGAHDGGGAQRSQEDALEESLPEADETRR